MLKKGKYRNRTFEIHLTCYKIDFKNANLVNAYCLCLVLCIKNNNNNEYKLECSIAHSRNNIANILSADWMVH